MRVRLKDVAAKAGVAVNTASTILNKRSNSWASKETTERVFKAAEELGYKPNRIALGLSTGRFNTIGLIIPDLHNPFFTSVAENLEESLRTEGYDLIIETTHSDNQREKKALASIGDRQIDGLVCALIDNEANQDFLREQHEAGKTVVAIKEALGPHTLPFHTVETDFVIGLKGAIDHLLNKGHDHFIFLLAKAAHQAEGLRPQVFKEYLKENGIEDSQIIFCKCDHTLKGSRREFARYLRTSGITTKDAVAVIAHNDLSALGVIRATIDQNLAVPKNVAVIGVDNTPIGEHLPIALSTIAQPSDHIVQNITSLLLSDLGIRNKDKDQPTRRPQHIVLPSWFIPRESG